MWVSLSLTKLISSSSSWGVDFVLAWQGNPSGGGGHFVFVVWGLDAQILCGGPWKGFGGFFGLRGLESLNCEEDDQTW